MLNKYLYFFAFAHMCCDLPPGSLPAILPFFVSDYGMNYTDVAGLMFASSFLSSFIQPLFGYLADKTSMHWFMSFGILISGVSLAVTGFTQNYWAIFLAVMLMGIGGSFFHPEAARLVNIISGARRGSGISIFSVGGNGGYGLGPILAVALVSGLGMKGLIIYGVLAVLMGLAVQHLTPRIAASADSILAQSQEEEKAAAASLNTAASETNFAKAEDSATQAADITKATQSAAATNSTTVAAKAPAQATPSAGTNDWRSFCRLTLVIVFRSVVINGIYSFLPLYCISILLTSKALGSTTLSVLSIAGILTTLVGGWIADKLGYVKVLRYGSLLLIPVMAAIVLTQNIWVVYLMMLPLSLAFNGTYAPFVVLGQTYLAKNIGFASGITLGLSMTVGGIITPVLGWYADHYGLPAAMNSLVVVAAICAACTFLLSEPEKRYNQ